ncbi:hypothetical protein AJ88_14805 [Mesorhizobium amorphae CCBAU 01583]|nr:hypothetical protein AJ88_14805 [Mesorhizobium amorphae CCBAU 01583]
MRAVPDRIDATHFYDVVVPKPLHTFGRHALVAPRCRSNDLTIFARSAACWYLPLLIKEAGP